VELHQLLVVLDDGAGALSFGIRDHVHDQIADNTGIPLRLIRIAVTYWASYPDEIDAEINAASIAENTAEDTWRRERQLLAG